MMRGYGERGFLRGKLNSAFGSNRPAVAACGFYILLALIAPPAGSPAPCDLSLLIQTLNNPSPSPNDFFGDAVAVSGNLAVVGADADDPGGVSEAGSARVFNAVSGALIMTLDNPDPTPSDFFGGSVGISAGYAIVGAARDDPGGIFDAGSAYVFNASTGVLVATLLKPNPVAADYFGGSVAISGGIAVVGDSRDDPGGVTDAGTVFVYNAMTGTIMNVLNNPLPDDSDHFGSAVAISGTLVAVGADWDDPGGITNAGRAYVFNAWTGALMTPLDNPDPAPGENFGNAIAISGNMVVVGAFGDSPGGYTSAGTAYVFNATSGALISTLSNPFPEASDNFGVSLGISGNLTVVGAYGASPGGVFSAGAAYAFNATTGILLATLSNPAPDDLDRFGGAVAVSYNLAIVGAYDEDPGGIGNGGIAYAFGCPNAAHNWELYD
ncbi:FG-GAP repeat protein [Candidatus Sumerlaeota bacterium]|nr:FG-GAP repeat protein [Candidatus Sumerlaeota bacterium]